MSEADSVSEVATQAAETHESRENSARENLVALRKKAELLEQQNLLLQQQMYQQQQTRQPTKQAEEVEEFFDYKTLEQENFPDGSKLAKAFGLLEKKMSKYDQKLSEKDRKIAMLEAAVQHKDYNELVTPENIKRFIEQDEDNLESVRKADNPGLKVYNLIKKELKHSAAAIKESSPEQKRVEEKEAKPKLSSIGVRSESINAVASVSNSRMTKEERAALWKETQSFARR